MSEVAMLGRDNVLAREKMFPGEALVLQPEFKAMFAQIVLGLGSMEKSMLELPHQMPLEVSQLLQTFWKRFSEVGLVTAGFERSVENVEAASFMSEKFGPITTAETAPVFKFLGGEIVDAQAFSRLSAQEMQSTMEGVQETFEAISALIFDNEIEQLENEVLKNEEAEVEVATTRVGANTALIMRVDEGKRNMRSKAEVLKKKIEKLSLKRSGWLNFSSNLTNNSDSVVALPMAA